MSDGFVPVELVARSGSEKAFEPSDPIEPVAVLLSTPGFDGITAMGRTFVEEFALMGWSRDRIRRMFTLPRYAAANAVWRVLGSGGVEALLDEVFEPPGEEA